MPKCTVKQGEDLGSIAEKYCLPSWKYLYELNKDAIGENPDLLEPGTKLSIPLWDSTSGDEKIEAKGAKAYAYIGGMGYRYPWVPFSVTIKNEEDEIVEENENAYEFLYVDTSKDPDEVLMRRTFSEGAEIKCLVPESQHCQPRIQLAEEE
jgi:hypothetical protein